MDSASSRKFSSVELVYAAAGGMYGSLEVSFHRYIDVRQDGVIYMEVSFHNSIGAR